VANVLRLRRPNKSIVITFARRERGSQLVEAAIALPIMLMLLGGIAEFGNFFYQYSTLTTACRAGARHASKWERNASWTFPETSTLVVYGDYSDTSKGPILPGLTTSNVVVQANGPSVNRIDSVTVKIVNYKYQPLFDLGKLTGITALSLKVDMNANATMHQLYNGPTAGS
jgi:hypothetical protein